MILNRVRKVGRDTTYAPSLAYIVERIRDVPVSVNQRVTASGVLICDHKQKILSRNASFTIEASESGKCNIKFYSYRIFL